MMSAKAELGSAGETIPSGLLQEIEVGGAVVQLLNHVLCELLRDGKAGLV